MKELIRVRVQYASRQQCCKTHKRPLPLPFLPVSRQLTQDAGIFWNTVCVPLLTCLFIYLFIYLFTEIIGKIQAPNGCYQNRIMAENVG